MSDSKFNERMFEVAVSLEALTSLLIASVAYRQILRSMRRNFTALLEVVQLSPVLVSSRSHDILLTRHRMRFIATRLAVASIFLGLATAAWIPIDVVLFDQDWQVILPLAAGRLIFAALFLLIGTIKLRDDSVLSGTIGVGLLVAAGVGFYGFAHFVLGQYGQSHLSGPEHAQYLLMPIALAAGISIFPLTLREVVALSTGPFAAMVVETVHGDGGLVWSERAMAVMLMFAVVATAVTCSVSQLKLLADLHERSTIDTLTGTLSRRAGMEFLHVLFARSQRSNTHLSLALFDLDRFKAVNDSFGHDVGDQVLQALSARIRARLRGQDVFIRWGGEEFVLVFHDTTAAAAAAVVRELCEAGLGCRPDGVRQTISVGLAERLTDEVISWQQLVEVADRRMYAAKELGRNRLVGPGVEPEQAFDRAA